MMGLLSCQQSQQSSPSLTSSIQSYSFFPPFVSGWFLCRPQPQVAGVNAGLGDWDVMVVGFHLVTQYECIYSIVTHGADARERHQPLQNT